MQKFQWIHYWTIIFFHQEIRCLTVPSPQFSTNSINCIKVSSFPNSRFLRNITHHWRMFWSFKRLRDNIFLHFCGCFLFWRENMGEEVSLLIAVAQFSCLSPLFCFYNFSNLKLKTSSVTRKKSWSCKNILLRNSIGKPKGINPPLSFLYSKSNVEAGGWWRVVSNALRSFRGFWKNMLSSEPLLTPERRRSYRRKWPTLACSSWTAGRSAVTRLIYLSKLWSLLALRVLSSPTYTASLFLNNSLPLFLKGIWFIIRGPITAEKSPLKLSLLPFMPSS